MLVSVNWLSQYIDLSDIDPKDLAEKISKMVKENDERKTK